MKELFDPMRLCGMRQMGTVAPKEIISHICGIVLRSFLRIPEALAELVGG